MDGITVEELPGHLRKHSPAIREQFPRGTFGLNRSRGAKIKNPGGGMRNRGISTVLDRFGQHAVAQVLPKPKRRNQRFSYDSHGLVPMALT